MVSTIEVLFSPAEYQARRDGGFAGSVCVVFDVLRATSVMLTGLANGAKGFVPVESGLVAVQGVRHVFDRLRAVDRGEPALVFITKGVEEAEVAALWRAMKGLS